MDTRSRSSVLQLGMAITSDEPALRDYLASHDLSRNSVRPAASTGSVSMRPYQIDVALYDGTNLHGRDHGTHRRGWHPLG